MEEPELNPARKAWLEKLAVATGEAIARPRNLDDPEHVALLEDLRTLKLRIDDELRQ
jgi:hypothetical protein